MGFLTFLIQGIPVVGKVVDAFTNYTNKRMDTDLEKYRVKGSIDVEAMKQDTEVIKARTNMVQAMKDDPATKSGRYYFIHGTGIYYIATLWDSFTFTRQLFTIGVLELPKWMQYMPYAVIVYLFAVSLKEIMSARSR